MLLRDPTQLEGELHPDLQEQPPPQALCRLSPKSQTPLELREPERVCLTRPGVHDPLHEARDEGWEAASSIPKDAMLQGFLQSISSPHRLG